MKENREPLRVYVAVDSSKIVRCMWCGVAESETWRRTRFGVYCSRDCFYAAQANGYLCVFFAEVITFSFIIGFAAPSALVVGVPLIILIFSPCLYCVRAGWDRQKNVPRNSRRDYASSDMTLLKAISSGISCPRCNANIDIRKVSEDRVYNCEYCGASGTVEVVKTH